MIEKNRVKKNFSKSAETYDEYAVVQRYMASRLIKFIDKEYNKILEIGCGTGIFTGELLARCEGSNFLLTDISEEMVNKVKEKTENKENIDFMICDGENVETDKKFDLIGSNAVFQWFENIERSLIKLKRNLNKDGEIIFSTFGQKTYFEMNEAFESIGRDYRYSQEFITKEKLEEIAKENFSEYIIEEEIYRQRFKSFREFLVSVKKIGASSGKKNKKVVTPIILKKAEEYYMKNHSENGEIIVTNHILFARLKN